MSPYVDFLDLRSLDLAGVALVVFAGESGTGKSTAMRFLAEHHESLADRPRRLMQPALGDVDIGTTSGQVVLLDEIIRVRQLALVRGLLRRENTVLVASHVPRLCFAPLRLRWRTRTFSTNRDDGKIAGLLEQRGIPFQPADVARFVRRFGANVTDLDCVLERSPGQPFGAALAYFERFHRLDRTPLPNGSR